jgi:general secretion pathway protein L
MQDFGAGHPGGQMVKQVLAWWVQQMLGWLPVRLRRPWRAQDAIVAEASPSGIALLARRRTGEVPLGMLGTSQQAGAPRGPVVLRLPPGALLQCPVDLPLAAERDLSAVLRYEMDRLTPFNPDDLYWTWRVQGRDRARGRLQVLLLLVPRQAVDATLGALRRAAAAPTALESADGSCLIPLAPADSRRQRRRRQALAAGAAACAGLAVAAVAVPFVLQSLAARRIEGRIAALRPQVDRVDALRRRIAGGVAGANVVAAQQAETGDPLAVLASVTEALADDTYLRELTLRGRVLTLAGQSAAAARLIPALAAVPSLRDPAFAAPVTRNEAAQADLFSVRATVAP